MNTTDTGRRLTIYVGESDSWRGRSLYMSILETLRKNGIAGATVIRGQAGFGAHSLIHTWQIERLSVDLPVIITVIDTPENVERALALVKPMVREGLITLEDVVIIKYTHRYLHPLPADIPVSEIMTRDVTTVTPDTPAIQVVKLLLGQSFKALPVINEQQQVVGIITEEDLLKKAGMPARLTVADRLETADLRSFLAQITAEQTAQQIMTSPAYTVRGDDALGYVVQQMLEHNFRRFPVVDTAGNLIGMVSRLDVLRTVGGNNIPEQERTPVSLHGQTLGEIMQTDLPLVHMHDDLVNILQRMLSAHTTFVIVLDKQQHAAGVITESDLVARVAPPMRHGILQALKARILGQDIRHSDATARDIMSAHVLSAPPNTTISEAITLMLKEGRKRIVIVDEAGHPIGLVDRHTLLAASLGQ